MDSDLTFSDADIAQASQHYAQGAQATAVGAANDNPDHAAQALDLSKATGAPAPVVYNDLDNFKGTVKAQAAGALVAGNPQLQTLTQDPMHARVTNDDLANLDQLSAPLHETVKPSIWERMKAEYDRVGEAFNTAFDPEGFKQEYSDLVNYSDNPLWQHFVRSTATVNPALLFDAGMRAMTGATSAATTLMADTYGAANGPELFAKYQQLDEAVNKKLGLSNLTGSADVSRGTPDKLASDLTTMAQVAFAPEGGVPHELNEAAAKASRQVDNAAATTRAFNGEPPPGVNPITDAGHIAQNQRDLAALKDALGKSAESLTRERAPDVFKQYVEQHTQGATIGISHDAVREMYGSEVPSPADGKLGFVSDLPAQMLRSAVTGADIQVPISDLATHVDPAVFSQLEPFVRTRPDGITATEAKTLASRDYSGDYGNDRAEIAQNALTEQAGLASREPIEAPASDARIQAGDAVVARFGPERAKTLMDYIDKNHVKNNGAFDQYIQRWFPDVADAKPLADYYAAAKKLAKEQFEAKQRRYIERLRADYAKPLGPADVLDDSDSPLPDTHVKTVDGADYLYKQRQYNQDKPGEYIDRYDLLGESAGLNDVIHAYRTLSDIHTSSVDDAFSTHLLDAFKRLGVDETPVNTLEKKDYENALGASSGGLYFGDMHRIALKHYDDSAWMHRVALHEGVHAATFKAIESNLYGARDDIRDLLNHVQRARPDYTGDTYGFTNEHEFVTEGLTQPEFRDLLDSTPMPQELADRILARGGPQSTLRTLWDGLVHTVAKILGFHDEGQQSVLDFFLRHTMDKLSAIAEEIGTAPDGDGALAARDRDPIADHAKAVGMNAKQTALYRELIEKQRAEEADARNARILADERKRQGAEWKKNEIEERKAASDELKLRPDVVADAALRKGTKLDTDALSDEQRAALDDAHTRGGVNPDDLAQHAGFDTGDQMIDAVTKLRQDRGDAQPLAHMRSMVEAETAKRMEAKYGDLNANVVDAAKDRVLSQTQMDMLHLDAEAQGLPITKDQLKANVRDTVGQMPMEQINSNAAMAAAGRAAQALEDALLRGDAKEAFAQRMRQYNHLLAAKEMVRIEKVKAQFDKLAKRFSATTVDNAAQEYTDHIRGLLAKLGQPVRGEVKPIDLKAFAEEKGADFRELHLPDFLQDPNFNTPLGKLPADQFEAAARALKAMAYNARDELKITKAGEKVDFRATVDDMVHQLRATGEPRQYPATIERRSFGRALGSLKWNLTIMETILNRFDRGDWAGDFNQTLVRTYTDAANYRERLLSEYKDKLNALGRIPDYTKNVENTLFRNPDPDNPYLLQMKKKNVLAVLQYAGERQAFEKLAAGYKLDPNEVMNWLHENTTKEDWDRAQAIGNHARALYDLADEMSQNVSGVGLDRVPLQKINTPFGEYDGWHNPVQYSYLREGKSKALMGNDGLEQHGFYSAISTPKSYLKTRTQYVAPVELDLDVNMKRMEQMIHDIAMRPAVIQLSKFFKDNAFRDAIRDYHGLAQRDALVPFLRDMANMSNFNSEAASLGNSILSWVGSNTVSTLVGFNPRTMMKHSTTAFVKSFVKGGPIGFAKEFLNLARDNGGQSNWAMAMEKSDELKRRGQNWQQLIEGQGQQVGLRKSGGFNRLGDFRSLMQAAGSEMLSKTDLLSAVPHWLAVYKEAVANGEDEGMAVSRADRDVRMTHGSSVFTNKAPIQRTTSAAARGFSTLYGFFSENLQKQFEIGWRARDAAGMVKEGQLAEAWGQMRKIGSLTFTSVLMPALIEEAVAGEFDDKKHAFGTHLAHILINGLTSGFIGIRDIAAAIETGRDPNLNIFTAPTKGIADEAKDIRDAVYAKYKGQPLGAAKTGKVIRDSTAAFGYLTGLTTMQAGRSAEYAYRYSHGLEHPKSLGDVFRGVIKGRS